MKEFMALPRQIQVGELLKFISIMIGSSIFPFMSMYYVHYFGTFITGLLTITISLVGFIATLYGGHLSDSIGRKKILLLGLTGSTIGWGISIIANIPGAVSPWLTFVGFLCIETFYALYSPAYEAMLIDLTDESNRRFVYTIGYWIINVAVMVGAGIAGLFYEKYFLQLMIVMSLLNAASTVCIYIYFKETKSKEASFDHGVGILDTFKNYGEVLKDTPFLIYSISTIFTNVIWLQVDNLIPVNLTLHFKTIEILGISISSSKMLSVAVFINTILIVFFMTTIGKLTKSWPMIPQLILGTVIFTGGIFVAFSFNSFYIIASAVVVYTIGEMLTVPASQVLKVEMMDENKIGSYSGFIAMAQPLATILAGTLVSLYHIIGLFSVGLVFITISLIGLVLVVISAKMKLGKNNV